MSTQEKFSSRLSFQTSAAAAPSSLRNNSQLSELAQISLSKAESKADSVNQIAKDLIQLQGARLSQLQLVNASQSGAAASASASASAAASATLAVSRASGAGSKAAASRLSLSGSRAGSASAAAAAAASAYISEFEQQLLRATVPIELNETEEITINGEKGIWANRAEVINWKGVIPITEYIINEDANPEIITKRTEQKLEYIQELAIRYLRPPTPPAPGEILITQEVNTLTPPAPPLIIRQQPARPETPEPLVIREAPPQPPAACGKKVITISGKRIPPPPRKVIIERLAALPVKPQSVLIERWLPYAEVKRRVIYQKSNEADAVVVKPRNVIVQWEAPEAVVKKEFKYLGVIKANPVEYVQRYGTSLKLAADLPQFVLDIKTPEGLVLAADYKYNELHELYGDIHALKLIDLDKEGLSAYREFIAKYSGSSHSIAAAASAAVSTALSIHESRAASRAASRASGAVSAQNASASFAVTGSSAASAAAGSASAAANFSQAALVSASSAANASAAASAAASASASASAAAAAAASSAKLNSASAANLNGLIETIFRVLDINNNGSISVEEAEKAVLRINSRLGRKYGEDDVNAFFAVLDSNKDGSLDFEEFKRAFLSLNL